MLNKKAQVGESITWMIATLVLIGILLIFIFLSAALAKTKSIKVNLKANTEDSVDWINSKTQMAYSINNANKNKIQGWISQAMDNG